MSENPISEPVDNLTSKQNNLQESERDWLLTQAYTRLQQRQFSDCITILNGLRVLAPENPNVYRMLSYALLMNDHPEECLTMADRYMQCIPPNIDTTEVLWIQGRARVRLEKAKEQSGDIASDE